MAKIIPRRQWCLHLRLEVSRDLRCRRNGLHMSMEDNRWEYEEAVASVASSIYKIRVDALRCSIQIRFPSPL